MNDEGLVKAEFGTARKCKKFTHEDRVKIEQMLREKKTVSQIAEALGRSTHSIKAEVYNCKDVNGVYNANNIRDMRKKYEKVSGCPKNFTTYVRRKQLEDMLRAGKTYKEIAYAMDASCTSVAWEVQTGGGRKKYNARERTDKIENRELLRGHVAKDISALKAQMKILTEMVLELKKGA